MAALGLRCQRLGRLRVRPEEPLPRFVRLQLHDPRVQRLPRPDRGLGAPPGPLRGAPRRVLRGLRDLKFTAPQCTHQGFVHHQVWIPLPLSRVLEVMWVRGLDGAGASSWRSSRARGI
eukprot:3670807-Pyramimonas_sp.AAC.1